jgi:hypothetical protein
LFGITLDVYPRDKNMGFSYLYKIIVESSSKTSNPILMCVFATPSQNICEHSSKSATSKFQV